MAVFEAIAAPFILGELVMSMRTARLVATVAGLGVAMPAAGQSIPWLNPVNGNWNEAAKWTGGNIPDAPGEIGRLNVAGTYTVTQNVAGLTLSGINVTTPTATLNLIGNAMTLTGGTGLTNSGTVVNSGGTTVVNGTITNNASGLINLNLNTALQLGGPMVNNGTLTVNIQGNSSFTTTLVGVDPFVVTGSGAIVLNANASAAQIAGVIENGAAHTIRGWGQITAALNNKGTVSASVGGQALTLNSSPKTNSGLMQATGSGVLSISGIAINQTGTGVIDANTGGSVNLASATINGGTLDSDAAVVSNVGGTSTLNDVTNLGNLGINLNTAIALGGSTFINEGVTTVNAQANASFTTTLQAASNMLIQGSGLIVLNAPNGAAQITAAPGVTITHGPDHTIRGYGQITAPMVNNGLISSDAGATIALNSNSKTNNATMEALASSILSIVGITITQSPTGGIFADAGSVQLTNATISGGTVAGINGGVVSGVLGTQTLTDVDLVGAYNINANTSTVLSPGDFTNDGTLTVNTQGNSSFTTTLAAGGAVEIDGTGTIVLNANAGAAQITGVPGEPLTLGSGQVVRGWGQITAPVVNNGVIQADINAQRITLNSNAKTNNALIRATGGGTLEINTVAITQTALGEMEASDGAFTLTNATISGGLLTSSGTGKFVGVGGTQTLNDIELAGVYDVNVNTTTVIGAGSLTNNGILTVNPQGNSSFTTTLATDGNTLIDGVGEIVLNANAGTAQITSTGVITFGSGQTVRGWGQITAPIVNDGLIRASVAGQSLILNVAGKTNNAQIEAGPSAILQINSITVTQSPSGSILADSGTVNLTNATLTGGALEAAGTGRFVGVSGNQTLSNLMLDAPFDVNVNTGAILSGAIENNGTITVNPQGNGSFTTSLIVSGPVSMTGDGEIVLVIPSGASQIADGGAGLLTMGPDNRLRGQGSISVPINNQGTISPGFSVGTIVIPAAATVITHEPGSVLDIELASAGSFDKMTGGSHTINGGTVNVTLTGGYSPALFTKHTIIDGSGASVVAGKFDGITGPALPSPWLWRIGYTAQDVIIGVSCPSDINADFIVDIVDFLDFLDSFGSCENQPAPCGTNVDADYNGDTFVDILDFLEFFDAFGSGC